MRSPKRRLARMPPTSARSSTWEVRRCAGGDARRGSGAPRAGLRQLEDADRLIARLLAQEPGNARFRNTALVIGHRLGDALADLGRNADAADRFNTVRAAAGGLSSGPYAANARMQQVLSTMRLARLREAAGDRSAAVFAEAVSREISARPVDTPLTDARIWSDLGHLQLRLASRGQPDERGQRRAAARAALERSASAWRQATLPRPRIPSHRGARGARFGARGASQRPARVKPSRQGDNAQLPTSNYQT